MVAAVRRGGSMRSVARRYGVSLSTVQWWVKRASGRRLDRVDWRDRPRIPRRVHRTPPEVEELVEATRSRLRTESDLGEYGAAAIRRDLLARGLPAPAVRTIGRILERRGLVARPRRRRGTPPPPGWYLPVVAQRQAELDSFDTISGLRIQEGPFVEVLTAVSLHGGLVGAWPSTTVTAKQTVSALVTHWRTAGLPAYAQFDNDTIFQGAHQYRYSISRVMRLCLSLGIVPVFTPPREHGFQAAVEGFNARWQVIVWARHHHGSLVSVQDRSMRFIAALRDRRAARIEAAPARRQFPEPWHLDLQQRPQGVVVFLRRTGADGSVSLLGHQIPVTPQWPHRLVRAEVDLPVGDIRFFALRRRDPADQPLLAAVPYQLPRRRFHE